MRKRDIVSAHAHSYQDRHVIIKEMEKAVHKEDLALQLQSASEYKHLYKITNSVGWKKLWDHTLDHGEACVTALKNLVRIVSHPSYACSPCPLCNVTGLNESLPTHVINEHTNSNESWDTLFNSILNLNSSLYSHILCFYNIFLTITLVLPTCVPSSITCSLPFCQYPGGPHDMILLLLLYQLWACAVYINS